jgi:tRNA modification GTPase
VSAQDTIVALATPPGRSGIGVIRLSGPESSHIVRQFIQKQDSNFKPNHASLRTLYHPKTKEVMDTALITYFKAPHSFTGEDVIEISCHGSPLLLASIIDLLLENGARAASPGEFTLRALSNGKLSLSQAEAIRDLIDSQTNAALRQAVRQLKGELSAQLQPIKDSLVRIIVPLESSLEFVEDDLPEVFSDQIRQELFDLIQQLERMASTYRSGRLLRDGLKVTLTGRPNVGKSSVFNRLLSMERAIVTDIPGTTRDSLSELISIDGVPVWLTDTAGIRSSSDVIESIGIERAKRALADADLILVVIDGSEPLTDQDREILKEVATYSYKVLLNKYDLITNICNNYIDIPYISISAKTGFGFDILRSAILQPFTLPGATNTDFLITNARHFDLLRRAVESLRSSITLLEGHTSEELILVGLYNALRYLGEITGETTPDDILTEIFSTFCIGK